MQLTQHLDNEFAVSGIENGALVILAQARRAPYWVSADGIELRIAAEGFSTIIALSLAHIERVLAGRPEVVLIATGARLVFPSNEIRAAFFRAGVGLEVMDTRAAAYTYNVLLQEQRKVLLLVLG
jgi:uncharacterized protein